MTVPVAHETKLNNYEEGNNNIHFFYSIENLKKNPGVFKVDRLASLRIVFPIWKRQELAIFQDAV